MGTGDSSKSDAMHGRQKEGSREENDSQRGGGEAPLFLGSLRPNLPDAVHLLALRHCVGWDAAITLALLVPIGPVRLSFLARECRKVPASPNPKKERHQGFFLPGNMDSNSVSFPKMAAHWHRLFPGGGAEEILRVFSLKQNNSEFSRGPYHKLLVSGDWVPL